MIGDPNEDQSERSKDSSFSSNYMHNLYSLLVIRIFAIFIGALIGLLRKYGCTLMVNLVRRISNYFFNINVHTPSAVNEILDAISTEECGSSSISSLSWDPRFTAEAAIISQNIKDMNDQTTQTSDHSSSIANQSNDSIIDIDLNAPLSPIELDPSFTAGIHLESDVDEDMTHRIDLEIHISGRLQIQSILKCNIY